jgi:hypothetical protein
MTIAVALILYALAFAAGVGYEFVKGGPREPA